MTTRAFAPLALERIHVSPGHSYVGRHGLGSVPPSIPEAIKAECVISMARAGFSCRLLPGVNPSAY